MQKHFQLAALQDNFQNRDGVLAMPAKWHEFGFSHEQLLHTHADMYSANYDPEKHHDLMAEYLERCRQNQMRVIVYMNCHILGPSLDGHRKDWGVRNEKGEYSLLYGTYASCCLNSPWRDYFFREIAQFAEFDIEGFFFDGPSYLPCFCQHCQEKYSRMHPGKKLLEAGEEEQKQFNRDSILDFKRDLHDCLKGVNPDWIMYANEGLTAGRGNADFVREQLATDDIVGTEGGFFFYSEPRTHSYWSCAFSAKLIEAVADGRPTVIFFAADQKPWGWAMHTPAESRLCYQAAIAGGASVWYGFHSTPDNMETPAARAVSRMVQFDRDHQKLLNQTVSAAEFAVFYSFNTQHAYRHGSQVSDFYNQEALQNQAHSCNYSESVNGAAGMLEHLSLAYDLVTELNLPDLKRYKAVLAPVLAMVDEPTKRALEEYVRQGGVLVMDGEAGWFDGEGGHFAPDRLRTLLGGTAGRRVENHRFNYFGVDASLYQPGNAFGYLRKPEVSFELQNLAPETQIIGRANPVMQGCYERMPGKLVDPVVVSHSYGAGKVYFFSMDFFGFYKRFEDGDYRCLLGNLLAQEGIEASFTLLNSRPGIMFNVRRSGTGSVIVFLNNYIGGTRPLLEPNPVAGLKIRTAGCFASARELYTGQMLALDENKNWVIPELDRVMMIEFAE